MDPKKTCFSASPSPNFSHTTAMSTTTTTITSEATSLRLSAEEVRLPASRDDRKSRLQQVVVITQLFAVTLTASVINGLVVVGLPTITADLQLPPSLSLWPSSVCSLATASTLLLSGLIADTIGPRWVELVGSLASGALMLGQGLSQTGIELVIMRAFQGVGLSMHLASSVSIVTQLLPPGKGRNLAFSCIGLSQPLGFSLGLVVGGILIDTIGWRAGWYIAAGITLFFAVVGLWSLPKSPVQRDGHILRNVRTKIDWVGAGLASAFMALLCYLLAYEPPTKPHTITLHPNLTHLSTQHPQRQPLPHPLRRKHHHPLPRGRGPPDLHHLGTLPSKARKTSLNPQRTVEKHLILQHLRHRGPLQRRNQLHGTLR